MVLLSISGLLALVREALRVFERSLIFIPAAQQHLLLRRTAIENGQKRRAMTFSTYLLGVGGAKRFGDTLRAQILEEDFCLRLQTSVLLELGLQ